MEWLETIRHRGTTLALPDKPALCAALGVSGRKKDSAVTIVFILYNIENDWIADAAIALYPTAKKNHGDKPYPPTV